MRQKNKKLINAIKVDYQGYSFDSQLECEFFKYLQQNQEAFEIKDIIVHPTFDVVKEFTVICSKCQKTGKVPSKKTGRLVKCQPCSGTGERTRMGTTFTPDFMILHKDSTFAYYDVKGFANDSFPLRKKLFERAIGHELIVAYKSKGTWKYK